MMWPELAALIGEITNNRQDYMHSLLRLCVCVQYIILQSHVVNVKHLVASLSCYIRI